MIDSLSIYIDDFKIYVSLMAHFIWWYGKF